MTGTWTVRLVATAELDFQAIIKRTAQEFSPRQAEAYADTLTLAIEALRAKGPKAIGVKERLALGPGIFALHAARQKRNASHFVVFRVVTPRTIEILRILHDRMDLARHV